MMDKMRKCPLAVMIVASTILLSLSAVLLHFASGRQLKISLDHPLFASILVQDKQGEDLAPSDSEIYEVNKVLSDLQEDESSGTETQEETIPAVTGENVDGAEPETGYPTKFIDKKKVKEDSPYYNDPGKIALTTEYPYVEVDKKYFDDALFIGDSRVEGLKVYSGLTNATFYCKQGITVYSLLTSKIVDMKIDGKKKKVTIVKALKQKHFSKIYIMVGINELGYKTTGDFQKQYETVVNAIKALQPDSKIFIMGIMKVTDEYSKKNEVFNNENINAKNVAIAELADGIDVFYLDFNPEITDSRNGIKKKYSWDGVHLKAEYYSIWVDFLKRHGM